MEKKQLLSLLLLFVILSSCAESETKNEDIKKQTKQIEEQSMKSGSGFSSFKTPIINEKLSINSKCIGCSHCVRFAPKNFSMDYKTRKAIVISHENIDTEGIKSAINICPVKAINVL